MPLIFHFMLAIEMILVACEGVWPASRAFLPIGGSHLSQLGFSLVMGAVLHEIGRISSEVAKGLRESLKEFKFRQVLWTLLLAILACSVGAAMATFEEGRHGVNMPSYPPAVSVDFL